MELQKQLRDAHRRSGGRRKNDNNTNNVVVIANELSTETSKISLDDEVKLKPTTPQRGGRRSGARQKDPDFDRGSKPVAKALFNPKLDSTGRGPANQPRNTNDIPKSKEPASNRRQRQASTPKPQKHTANQELPATPSHTVEEDTVEIEANVKPFKQLDVPQIQPDQLIREAKSIYAAMLMVENKCNEVDRLEDAKIRAGEIQSIPATRYKELVVLHRTLLYEQYDFFLACSHPAATPQLRLLPHKYGMPGRIWKSGIHTFLEVLRHHLPESLEHMLTFLHMAYGVVCLLFETIPSHKATWIECLGDLARYRMAVEERDAEIRDIWTDSAREWYFAATDIFPSVGRLYHHLAIVARQNPVEQLYLYVKSLTVDLIFTGTRESILILFQTVAREPPSAGLVTQVDYLFVQLHQMLFTKVNLDSMSMKMGDFIRLLKRALEYSSDPETPDFWGSRSTHIAICGIGSLYQYGAREGIFRSFNEQNDLSEQPASSSVVKVQPPPPPPKLEHNLSEQPASSSVAKFQPPPPPPNLEHRESYTDEAVISPQFSLAKELAMQTLEAFLSCNLDNAKVLHLQVWLVFMDFFIRKRRGIMETYLEADIPWDRLVQAINEIFQHTPSYIPDFSDEPVFPEISKAPAMADDYALRALVWASDFHPKEYFANHLPESDRSYEHPTGTQGAKDNFNLRKERILYLAARICKTGGYLKFDSTSQQFELDQALQCRMAEYKRKSIRDDTPATSWTPQTDSASYSDLGDDNTGVSGYNVDPSDLEAAPNHIQELLQKERDLAARLNKLRSNESDSEVPALKPETTVPKSIRDIRKKQTMVVIDTNFLLSNLPIFKNILQCGDWVVVVPNPVVIELLGISRNDEANVGLQAKAALLAINEAAATNNPNLRIITSRGNRIQQPGFYREHISNFKAGLEGGIDDVIISIAVKLGQGETQATDALPVVLLTNDKNMRLMAKAHGVFGLSSEEWSKQFGPGRVDKRVEKRKLAGSQSHNSPRSPRRKSSETASYTVERLISDNTASPVLVGKEVFKINPSTLESGNESPTTG